MPFPLGSSPVAEEEWPVDLPTRAYIGSTGLVLGDVDAYGVQWKWGPSNAWGPKPSPREEAGDRAHEHGQWDATRFYGPRVMAIAGSARAPSHAALHAAEQRLRDAITISAFPLRITEPGWDGWCMVRQQGEVLWTENAHGHASWSIALYGANPLIWSSRVRTFSTPFPATSGGLVWPTTWPATWTAVEARGEVALANPGTVPVPLRLRVDGPVGTATIANAATGEALHLANPIGPLLTAGQWLVVDTDRRQVLLQGDAGRRSWARGTFLRVPPGLSQLVVGGTGIGPGAGVSGEYRAARI